MNQYREITTDDVGKGVFLAFGRTWSVNSFIGRILKQDVGKRVYLIGSILQVESNEQMSSRLAQKEEEEEEEYFSIVWLSSKMYRICSSKEMEEEYLQLMIGEPEVMVLKPTRIFSYGKEIT